MKIKLDENKIPEDVLKEMADNNEKASIIQPLTVQSIIDKEDRLQDALSKCGYVVYTDLQSVFKNIVELSLNSRMYHIISISNALESLEDASDTTPIRDMLIYYTELNDIEKHEFDALFLSMIGIPFCDFLYNASNKITDPNSLAKSK